MHIILLQCWFRLQISQRYCSILGLIFWRYGRCNEYLPSRLPWCQHIENDLWFPITFTYWWRNHLTVLWYFNIPNFRCIWCLRRRLSDTFLVHSAFLYLLFQHIDHHFLYRFSLKRQLLLIFHRGISRRLIIELERSQSRSEIRQLIVSWLSVKWRFGDTSNNLIVHSRWCHIISSNLVYIDGCDLCQILILDLLVHRCAAFLVRLHSERTFLVTVFDGILFLRRGSWIFIDLNFDLLAVSHLIWSYGRFFGNCDFFRFAKVLTIITLQLLLCWAEKEARASVEKFDLRCLWGVFFVSSIRRRHFLQSL